MAEDGRFSRAWREQFSDDADERGFTCTIGAEKLKHSSFDFKLDPSQRLNSAIVLVSSCALVTMLPFQKRPDVILVAKIFPLLPVVKDLSCCFGVKLSTSTQRSGGFTYHLNVFSLSSMFFVRL